MIKAVLDETRLHTAVIEPDGSLVIEPPQEDKDETRLTAEETYHLYLLLHEHYRSMEKAIHTDHKPFCDDLDCPCHEEYGPSAMDGIHIPFDEGLLTEDEAHTLFEGRNI